jgi:hypothetical protein
MLTTMRNMTDRGWDLEFYADEHGREPCREWMEDLSPVKKLALETALDDVLAERGTDVVRTEFGKALGQGLYEFTLRWTAGEVRSKVGRVSDSAAAKSEKILLRVFFCTAGRKIILLLSGYDKAVDDSRRRQDREIARARKFMTAYREAERRRMR